MRWLRENGFMPVSVDKIASALRGQATLPAKPIAITFDDGWKNQLNALPILREYGFIGTFYLVANYIANDSSNFVGWKDATTLLNQGHLLGSHSGRHSQQTKLFGANLAHDVIAARTAIHSHLGVTVTTHAYPYGSTNATVIRAVINAGYTAALGVWSRAYQSSSAIYNLNRLDAAGDISLIDFAKLMQGGSLNRAPAMPLTHHPSSRLQKSLPVKNTSSITSRA
jgi:peptidoglycan/xylan/chitin deacetylase (PgdA/CDA1 family)